MREIVNSRGLPAFQPLQRHLERGLGALLRAQVRAPAVARRGARRRGAIERHHAHLHHDRLHRLRASPRSSYAMQLPDVIERADCDGNASNLLDSFLRGNRDDQPRKHGRLHPAGAQPDEQPLRRCSASHVHRHQRQPAHRAEPEPGATPT